jgi:hypothetical protein
MPDRPRALTEYEDPRERHFSWSREWRDLPRRGRVVLYLLALVVFPAISVAAGVSAFAGSHGGRFILMTFMSPTVAAGLSGGLARLQNYAVCALAIGALFASGVFFLGFLMWAGAHGAFS